MHDAIHYTRARRQRYMQEIGLAAQVDAMVEELRALRLELGLAGSGAFTDLLARLDDIRADIPKDCG